MIESDGQLKITKGWVESFRNQLDNLLLNPFENPLRQKLHVDSLITQLHMLEQEINEYESKAIR